MKFEYTWRTMAGHIFTERLSVAPEGDALAITIHESSGETVSFPLNREQAAQLRTHLDEWLRQPFTAPR